MAVARRKVDRAGPIFLTVLCVTGVIAFGVALWPLVGGAFTSPSDVEFAHPELAVREARALIADRAKNPQKYGPFTEPEALPESLRIPNLRYAKVHDDHVDLVIARNPDWSVGARIWSVRPRPHRDQATSYRDIYFYRYTHESPETPDNVR